MSLGPGIAAAGRWKNLQPALSEPIMRVLTERLGFTQMTPVQAATLPKFLQHKDVAVEVRPYSPSRLACPVWIFNLGLGWVGFATRLCRRRLDLERLYRL